MIIDQKWYLKKWIEKRKKGKGKGKGKGKKGVKEEGLKREDIMGWEKRTRGKRLSVQEMEEVWLHVK